MPIRKLLIISYHFTPDGAVGGLRWAGLGRYLATMGWDVHVLTAAAQTAGSAIPGVHVHHVPRSKILNDHYAEWTSQRGGTQGISSAEVSAESAAPETQDTFSSRLRKIGAEFLITPDWARGWVTRAALSARELLRSTRFNVVVSSGPPHSVHIASALAVSGLGVPLVIDMRDPWDPVGVNPLIEEGSLRYRLLPVLERSTLPRAAMILANTGRFADTLRARYPLLRVECVSNGVDPARLPSPAEKFPGLSIAYAGSMYMERNLGTVLRAMQQLFSKHPGARGACTLRVAGALDEEQTRDLMSVANDAGVAGNILLLGSLKSAAALDLINRSRVALVLAQNQPVQVPAKIYECVAMGVTTLVITENTSATAAEATRIGALVCEPLDVNCATAILERLHLGTQSPPDAADSFTYDFMATRVSALLEQTARPR